MKRYKKHFDNLQIDHPVLLTLIKVMKNDFYFSVITDAPELCVLKEDKGDRGYMIGINLKFKEKIILSTASLFDIQMISHAKDVDSYIILLWNKMQSDIAKSICSAGVFWFEHIVKKHESKKAELARKS